MLAHRGVGWAFSHNFASGSAETKYFQICVDPDPVLQPAYSLDLSGCCSPIWHIFLVTRVTLSFWSPHQRNKGLSKPWHVVLRTRTMWACLPLTAAIIGVSLLLSWWSSSPEYSVIVRSGQTAVPVSLLREFATWKYWNGTLAILKLCTCDRFNLRTSKPSWLCYFWILWLDNLVTELLLRYLLSVLESGVKEIWWAWIFFLFVDTGAMLQEPLDGILLQWMSSGSRIYQ